ncbi:Signal-transduction histidine kinase senX3 [bioreactor metagenome]|uniref:histidine kinase n=1 Tax=bioreactor metagenome TaxID=1076179 RepID=A0A645BMD3_9ZZZZ
MEMEITDTDLSEPAAECVRALKPFAEKCSVAISTEGCGHAVCDKKMIFELIYNLLDNAIRYNVTGGSATVKVADKLISVKDTGIGISDEHKSRIFERFYRIDKSRSRMTGGTGLGLAIVKHIAESHGAKISVISSPGKGTEFNVTFKE